MRLSLMFSIADKGIDSEAGPGILPKSARVGAYVKRLLYLDLGYEKLAEEIVRQRNCRL